MLPRKVCKRCNHTWIPRKDIIIICPKCKSPYWNIERKDGGVKKEVKVSEESVKQYGNH